MISMWKARRASGRKVLPGKILVPLIIVGLVLVGVGPASALMISFVDPISPTANSLVTTDIAGSVIMTSPESASLNVTIMGLVLPEPISASIALREGSLTGPISDLLTVSLATNGALIASFTSDPITEVPLPGTPLVNFVETGLLQQVFSMSLGPVLGILTISTQSDV